MSEASTKTDVRLAMPDAKDRAQVERWTSHRLRDDPALSWVCGGLAVLMLMLVIGTTGKWYLGLLALGAAAVVFWRLYLPVTYELDARGLRQTVWKFGRFVPWKQVDRAELSQHGVLLLPQAGNELFARLRSIHVPCSDRLVTIQRIIEVQAPWAATWARDEQSVG
ncbi:MAG: hypothetical protein OES79_02805 [Planctomycetota bacterium]|nr:hypothetical protein [Planctomycetota bacterium]